MVNSKKLDEQCHFISTMCCEARTEETEIPKIKSRMFNQAVASLLYIIKKLRCTLQPRVLIFLTPPSGVCTLSQMISVARLSFDDSSQTISFSFCRLAWQSPNLLDCMNDNWNVRFRLTTECFIFLLFLAKMCNEAQYDPKWFVDCKSRRVLAGKLSTKE